jgi:hypothetical protein
MIFQEHKEMVVWGRYAWNVGEVGEHFPAIICDHLRCQMHSVKLRCCVEGWQFISLDIFLEAHIALNIWI